MVLGVIATSLLVFLPSVITPSAARSSRAVMQFLRSNPEAQRLLKGTRVLMVTTPLVRNLIVLWTPSGSQVTPGAWTSVAYSNIPSDQLQPRVLRFFPKILQPKSTQLYAKLLRSVAVALSDIVCLL